MSDDKDRKGKDKDRDKRTNEDDKSTPDPINSVVTSWFERLFRGQEQPTVVFSTRLGGRKHDQLLDEIKRYPFRQGDEPSKEDIVRVSNEFMMVMQAEADTLEQPRFYRLQAQNPVKGGDFDSWPVRCDPRPGRGALVRAGDSGDSDGDGIDDATGGDVLRKRAGDALADVRFHTEINMQTSAGLLTTVVELLKDFRDETRELRADYRAQAKQLNEAQNSALDREIIRKKEQFKLDAQMRGVDALAALFPGWARKMIAGDSSSSAAVTTPSIGTQEKSVPAAEAIKSVVDKLTRAEEIAIFGMWKDNQCTQSGVLTASQVQILAAVMNENAPEEALDRLFRGPDRVTEAQYVALSRIVDLDKFGPLIVLLKQRQEKVGVAVPPPAPKTEG